MNHDDSDQQRIDAPEHEVKYNLRQDELVEKGQSVQVSRELNR